jgi:glycosyltransferase involved in cell wall biosynthesis
MRACDVLVAPFLDSFGPSDYFMAVLEAMASGKPTIVSTGGGMPEIVGDDVGRLVDPRDPAAIGDAIAELAGDAALRDRLGRAARAKAESLFDPGRVAATVRSLYERITSP